jgi:Pvc16 N-terminal domain
LAVAARKSEAMSTAQAIAAVTATLKDVLSNGLVEQKVVAGLGNVTVSALPPDRVDSQGGGEVNRLNLFLYRIEPNTATRNVGPPGRGAAGRRITHPPLALDLHYLLIAYGSEELHGEMLLGHGMKLLHETPVLTRDALRRSLAPPAAAASGSSTSARKLLFTAELADQMEPVRITPAQLTVDELTRLWSALQCRFRTAAAYIASVVLI